jgi:hypothetical protein
MPSGHRRYTEDEARRLKLLVRAMVAGSKPKEVADMEIAELTALLSPSVVSLAPVHRRSESRLHPDSLEVVGDWLDAVHALDSRAFDQGLRGSWVRHGGLVFILELAPTFLSEIGDAWSQGALTVAHEHFASEGLLNFLGEAWREHRPKRGAPKVLATTLPGEQHYLALHLVAVLAAVEGLDVLFLGRDTPLAAIASATRRVRPELLCVSISISADPDVARALLVELRRVVDREVVLLAGGAGASRIGSVDGVEMPDGLAGLHERFAREGALELR